MIRVAIVGVGGKMGSLVAEAIAQTRTMSVIRTSEQGEHQLLGTHLSTSHYAVQSTEDLDLHDIDVAVDFTTPACTMQVLEKALRGRCGMVIGTTGFSEAQLTDLYSAAKSIPVFWSPNMSIGVHRFFRTVETLACSLGLEYDIEVIEIHHNQKKDAPSGTARKIAAILQGVRPHKPVSCHSLRIGGVVGEHQVHFAARGERITLIHSAESREIFTSGAIKAIEFVSNKDKGFFTMEDLL